MRKSISIVAIFILTSLFFISSGIMNAQENPEENKNTGKWFTSKEVAEGIYCIDDHGGDNMYLVLGKKKALLIDTGTGVSDLKKYVISLTDLPLMILNTHGHPDHVGNNFQFDEVYVHPKDFDYVKQFSSEEFRESMVDNALRNFSDLQSEMIEEVDDYTASKLLPVEEGYIFDLGDRQIEVIETPGHTPGSICLLDKENKLIITGDNNNTVAWLFLDGCLPLEGYVATLTKQKEMSHEFNVLFPGHGEPLDIEFIDEQITCAKNILEGKCEATHYETFVDNAMQCEYKRSRIAFNPDNLFYDK